MFFVASLFQYSLSSFKHMLFPHHMWSIQIVDIKAIGDIIKHNLNRFYTLKGGLLCQLLTDYVTMI